MVDESERREGEEDRVDKSVGTVETVTLISEVFVKINPTIPYRVYLKSPPPFKIHPPPGVSKP